MGQLLKLSYFQPGYKIQINPKICYSSLALHHMEKGRYFILKPPIFVQAFISSEKAGGPFRIIITFCGRSLSAQVIRLSIFFIT